MGALGFHGPPFVDAVLGVCSRSLSDPTPTALRPQPLSNRGLGMVCPHVSCWKQVDLAVYGHHHSYQRTCKVVGEVCEGMSSQGHAERGQDYVAPVHVVLGMAGMGLSQNMVSPRPEWVEYATDREFGLGMLVADRSKLRLSFVLDADGQVTTSIFFGLFLGCFACLEPGIMTS